MIVFDSIALNCLFDKACLFEKILSTRKTTLDKNGSLTDFTVAKDESFPSTVDPTDSQSQSSSLPPLHSIIHIQNSTYRNSYQINQESYFFSLKKIVINPLLANLITYGYE